MSMGLFSKLFGGPPGKDEFARLMMDSIRKAGEKTPLRYEADEFRIAAELDDSAPHFLYLVNAYNEYCSVPHSERAGVLRRFTRTWFSYYKEIPKDFADVLPDLLPSLRNRSYFEINKLH